MRIVGGKWAGRHLTSPPDRRVRPTAEGVRDAWMKLVEPYLEGARLIDLFAGTGALGLEAMSRGAKFADFVEDRPASLHALKANVAALHVREKTRIFKKDALRFAAALEPGSYDLAFADPPYGSRMLDRLIEGWQARPFSPILAVEHAADHELPAGGRRYLLEETTAVTLYRAPRRAAASPPADDSERD
ncbi:MAG: RsmD family RNA methyltransferase [Gemmatimonadota bacterium]